MSADNGGSCENIYKFIQHGQSSSQTISVDNSTIQQIQMLPAGIIAKLDILASQYVVRLFPLAQTTALIVRNEKKFDRIDTKLKKEADKLNKKQQRGEVKQEYRAKQRVGAITYKSYTIQFKKKLIAQIRQELQRSNECLSKIIRAKANYEQIHPKNLTRWYHTKELKKKEGGRRALYPEMEIRLANFILNNPKMKRKHILRQARQIMEDLKIPGRDKFNFSKGWYERFRERLSKQKVAKGANLGDVKLEGKYEFQTKYEEDQVKKEEEEEAVFEEDDRDFQGFDESSDQEENVKIEEELDDTQDEHDDIFNARLSDSQDDSQSTQKYGEKAQQSLFFDDEQESNKPSANQSAIHLINEERRNLPTPTRRSTRRHL